MRRVRRTPYWHHAAPSAWGTVRCAGRDPELITVIETRYEFVHVKQQKYSCKCGGCIEPALGPERATSGSRYSLAFAIKIVLDKWLDHVPPERQCRILEWHGFAVTSQTLWDLASAIAHRLERVSVTVLDHCSRGPVGPARRCRRQAVAVVVPHRAGHRRAPDPRGQEHGDVHGPRELHRRHRL